MMFNAVHKNEGVSYHASEIWDKFNNCHNEKWYCCKIHKFPVTPVTKHTRMLNGEETNIPSHFRLTSEGHFCPGESDIHWNLKVNVALGIESGNIKLISNEKTKYNFSNCENIQSRLERAVDKRRADILFELEKTNTLIGKGIVIEIAVSEKIESLHKKTIDWIKNGYSVTWIREGFNENEIKIKYLFGLYRDIVRWCNRLEWDNYEAKRNGAYNGQN